MKIFKILLSKGALIALAIIVQFAMFYIPIYVVNMNFQWVQSVTWILSVLVFLFIVNKNEKPEYKLPWIVLVLLLPILGLIIYLLFGDVRISKKHVKLFNEIKDESAKFLSDAKTAEPNELGKYSGQSLAITSESGFPAYKNSQVKYFDSGESFYASLLEDLQKAERFIFMEYFIIEEGKMWNSILDVLREKVAIDVDVRVIYDDIGCLWKLKNNYYKTLISYGIKCVKFNRFNPSVSNVHNYRDHRKITVIDGVISYTGGINLADEYINEVELFGHWKDTAVRIEGEATKSFTIMFLQSYILMSGKFNEDYSHFLDVNTNITANGIIQPFGASAMYKTGETAILNMINQSQKYVYITTPYLICDYAMINALKRASQRGVDVRIIVPNIPDKKIVWHLTRSNFETLIKSGIKIYQYTAGFIHAKTVICDDDIALVGTINLDYRSLVHHFEDGVLMYKTDCIKDIYNDLKWLFTTSELQTEQSAKLNFFARLFCAVIKIFSPLM